MSANPSATLVKALDFIVHGPSRMENPQVYILHYHDDATFQDLWLTGLEKEQPAIHGTELNWKNGDQQILILGNDPPVGILDKFPTVNVRNHFTATSWLAAWKVKFGTKQENDQERKQRKEERKPFPEARIAVIDPREPSSSSGVSHALQTIFGARDASGQTLVPRATVLNAPSLANICRWLAASKADNERDTPDHLRDLLKSTIWNELTSDREQHHALSNVLGALLLMAQVGPPGLLTQKFKLPVQEFLLSLVRACGVEAQSNRSELTEQCDKTPGWISESIHREIAGAVLIDDMADLWTPFLAVALALHGPSFSRFVATQPDSFPAMLRGLPRRLETVLARGGNARITATDLVPGTHTVTDDFVLFLDLRLFATQGQDSEADFFFEALASFGISLLDSGRNVPWLDSEHAKSVFRAELEGSRQGTPIKNRETLLARLIALLDPTLPVIIFSSTRRSELTDSFRNYGNIVTVFRKPVLAGFHGDWATTVAEIRADFLLATEQAMRVLRTRRAIARLDIVPSLELNLSSPSRRIVEIYIDESGDPFRESDPGFAVGGIVLRHDSEKASREFHRVINQSAKKWGVSDHAADRIRADEVDEKLAKVSFYPKKPVPGGIDEREGFKLVASALSEGSRIAAFALIDPDLLHFNRDRKRDGSILFARNTLDNAYHSMLRANLELLLFQHPWIDISTDSIAIHVATRQQEMDDTPTRQTWHHAYGLEFKMRRGRWGYTSLGSDSVFRLVREILQTRSHGNKLPDIAMARGVTLNDYEDVVRNYRAGESLRARVNSQLYDPSRVDPHQVHYVADWIVRIALYRKKPPAEISPWFEAGYVQPLSETFGALLDACRQREPDQAVQRLDGVPLTPLSELSDSWYVERYLRQSASTWPSKLTSLQLHSLISNERRGQACLKES